MARQPFENVLAAENLACGLARSRIPLGTALAGGSEDVKGDNVAEANADNLTAEAIGNGLVVIKP